MIRNYDPLRIEKILRLMALLEFGVEVGTVVHVSPESNVYYQEKRRIQLLLHPTTGVKFGIDAKSRKLIIGDLEN